MIFNILDTCHGLLLQGFVTQFMFKIRQINCKNKRGRLIGSICLITVFQLVYNVTQNLIVSCKDLLVYKSPILRMF